MDIREAVEADAERMADIAGSPPDVMRNLVHDRTVRVATETRPAEGSRTGPPEREGDEQGETRDETSATARDQGTDQGEEEAVVGLVSFDARDDTVHVTQLAGTSDACVRLVEEPVRFARGEGMAVELLVGETDDTVQEAVENAGFRARGSGPQFEGEATTRYRLEPGKAEQ